MVDLVGLSVSLARSLKKKNIPFLPKLIRMMNRVVFSCDIPPEADIHKTVFFSHHGLGVVINPNARIGENTKLLHNVTIGGTGRKRRYNNEVIVAPVIGKNVLIGSGAQIIGPVIIGDNVRIGSGSIVTKDIPSNKIAVGVPARVIKDNDF